MSVYGTSAKWSCTCTTPGVEVIFCKTYRQVKIGRPYLDLDFCNTLYFTFCFTFLFHSENCAKIQGKEIHKRQASTKSPQPPKPRSVEGLHQGTSTNFLLWWAKLHQFKPIHVRLFSGIPRTDTLRNRNWEAGVKKQGRWSYSSGIRNDSEWLALILFTKRTTLQKTLAQVTTRFSESTDQRGTS